MKNIKYLILFVSVLLAGCKTLTGMGTGEITSFDPVPYKPDGKTQFYLVEKSPTLQSYGYDSFCEDLSYSYCHQKLPYQQYKGMKGYFETEVPVLKNGLYYYPVVFENGLRVYFQSHGQKKFSAIKDLRAVVTLEGDTALPYNPSGKEEFVIGEPAYSSSTYENLCLTDEVYTCKARLSAKKYQNQRGYFISKEPVLSSATEDLYPIMLSTGEQAYYKARSGSGLFGRQTEIVRLDEWKRNNIKMSEPLVPGSEVTLNFMRQTTSGKRYELSNGETLSQKQLDAIRHFYRVHGKSPEAAGLLSKMNITYDEVERRFFVQPRLGYESSVQLYIGAKGSDKWLRFKAMYYGKDWIFAKSFKVAADDYRWQSPVMKFSKDNTSSVWEWVDLRADSHYIALAKKLAAADSSIVRFQGDQYYHDHKLSSEEKTAIQDVLKIYRTLK